MFSYAPVTKGEKKVVKRRVSDLNADAAIAAANRLSKLGQHKEANDVRRMVKSHSALRGQVHYLWDELRRIEGLEAEARKLLAQHYGPCSPGFVAEAEYQAYVARALREERR